MGWTASEIEVYQRQVEELGFCIIEDVVTKNFALQLRASVLNALDADMARYGGRSGKLPDLIDNLLPYGGPFFDLLAQPVFRSIFQTLLDPACILYNYSSSVLRPGSAPPASEIHVDSPRIIPGYKSGLLMTLALDDFTQDNGATLYLPGSQTLYARPSAEDFERSAVSVERPRCAAVVFNPRVWHRAGANNTDTIRCGVTVYAVRPFMKQRFDFPRMISAETRARLNPQIEQFLGFDARIPSTMDEYYVPTEQRLYKGGQG